MWASYYGRNILLLQNVHAVSKEACFPLKEKAIMSRILNDCRPEILHNYNQTINYIILLYCLTIDFHFTFV
jgi:hypothetical protein